MAYFIGIDLGTSYFKTALVDKMGHIKGLSRQPVPYESDPADADPDGGTCVLPVEKFTRLLDSFDPRKGCCMARTLSKANSTSLHSTI